MPRSTNLNRYGDIKYICDIALATGECVWSASAAGVNNERATHVLQRFFSFRKLAEDIDPATPYSGLQGAKDLTRGTVTIYDSIKHLSPGIVTEYDEEAIVSHSIDEVALDEDDPLEAARKLLGSNDIV